MKYIISVAMAISLMLTANAYCAEVNAVDRVNWVLTHAKTYRTLYFSQEYGNDKNSASDIPVLNVGGSSLGVVFREPTLQPFDLVPIENAIKSNRHKSHSCLCIAEYSAGLSLFDRNGNLSGWVLFSKNHNSIALVDNNNKMISEFRYQEFLGDGLFKKSHDTLDLNEVLVIYKAKLPE